MMGLKKKKHVSEECITDVGQKKDVLSVKLIKYSENMAEQQWIFDLVIETTIKEELLNCI